jgi:hypothetical protein
MEKMTNDFGIWLGIACHIIGFFGLINYPIPAIVFAFPAGIVLLTIALRELGKNKKAWMLLVVQTITYMLVIGGYIATM